MGNTGFAEFLQMLTYIRICFGETEILRPFEYMIVK